MKWSYEHNEICCKIYKEEVIIKKNSDKNLCIKLAKISGLPQTEGSIKMKFSNIRSLCDKFNIKHDTPFTPLSNYSETNERTFKSVMGFS